MGHTTLHERLSGMSHAAVTQWLRDRGIFVLEPEKRPKSVLVSIALDAQHEHDAGRIRLPQPNGF
jgi:hypothetical protein